MNAPNPSSALVLFSGGQDSATSLAWALERFERVETIGFSYGQTHNVEMDLREPIRIRMRELHHLWDIRLGSDSVVPIDTLGAVSTSALLGGAGNAHSDGLPATFVPGRNLIFFMYAAIVALRRDIKHLVGGMCETDYSGYPDCRDNTLKALQVALNLGMECGVAIETPLMWLDKAATWRLALTLGGEQFVDLVTEWTHTCYRGDREHRHTWGYGCAECDACRLRARGWNAWRSELGATGIAG